MKIRLIRHATLWIEYGGLRIVADPMLAGPGVNPSIPDTPNPRNNPLVPLPIPAEELLAADLLIVSHLHRDHWDEAAAGLFPKETPILCQPEDEHVLREQGFTRVSPVESDLSVRGVAFRRTSGRHGTGQIGCRMGRVSGFVLHAESEPSLYIAGDTVFGPEVEQALLRHRPDWTVVNAGGARFRIGDPITMTAEDVAAVCRTLPETKVAAVHMEAINHCLVTREELRKAMDEAGLSGRVAIPEDGEWLTG